MSIIYAFFRFIQKRDSVWRNHVLQTDDVDPQWRQVMRSLKIGVTYALSPQAKGKIERPFRWLQDRIVRTCALEGISSLEDARSVLHAEVERYNNHQVHSTTGKIPAICFDQAKAAGNSLFRPFSLPKPFISTKDVFCLHTIRTLNGYRKISLAGMEIEIPKVPIREDVELHLVPQEPNLVEIRAWFERRMVHSFTLPVAQFRGVHFSTFPNRIPTQHNTFHQETKPCHLPNPFAAEQMPMMKRRMPLPAQTASDCATKPPGAIAQTMAMRANGGCISAMIAANVRSRKSVPRPKAIAKSR